MLKFVTATLLLTSAVAAFAQTVPPPVVPELILYRHWPQQFVQWVGTELPYSMIELYVDPGATPLYEVVLTERASGKRVHYANQQPVVELDKRSGADAYLANIQLDRPANAGTGGTYLLRFVDHAGQPVSWQFIQGSDMSERGGGSSPAGTTPPVVMYRERGAVAGEGTALKIGNTISNAEVWTEISQPPYFIAYHGAVSENVDIAVFAGTPKPWTTVSAPSTLAPKAEWKLRAEDGAGRTLTLQTLAGTHATLIDNDDHFPGRTLVIEADWANGAWTIDKLHYAGAGEDANQGLTITLANGKFEVIAGRKTRIANGTVHPDGWEFKDPAWLRGKTAR